MATPGKRYVVIHLCLPELIDILIIAIETDRKLIFSVFFDHQERPAVTVWTARCLCLRTHVTLVINK